MTTQLKVDEEELQACASALQDLIDGLTEDVNRLINKEADLFMRYLSYIRFKSIDELLDATLTKDFGLLKMGMCLSDPVFHTPKFFENRWHHLSLKNNSFFENEAGCSDCREDVDAAIQNAAQAAYEARESMNGMQIAITKDSITIRKAKVNEKANENEDDKTCH